MTDLNLQRISAFLQQRYGLTGSLQFLVGELDLNYRFQCDSGEQYVVKVSHKEENRGIIELQHAMLFQLKDKLQELVLGWPKAGLDGQSIQVIDWQDGPRLIRLLDWVPGILWSNHRPIRTDLLEDVGHRLAQLSNGLTGFDHPAAHRWLKWDPSNLDWIETHLDLFEGAEKAILGKWFTAWQSKVKPLLSRLPKSVIYGDANDNNILLTEDAFDPKVAAFFDFGDAVYSATIHELAIGLAYFMMDQQDPVWAACSVIRAYHQVAPLSEEEISVLLYAVMARLMISVTASRINSSEHPDNAYLQVSDQAAWKLIRAIDQRSPDLIHYCFRWACGMSPHPDQATFEAWCASSSFADPVAVPLSREDALIFDCSIGSQHLGEQANFIDHQRFDRRIDQLLQQAQTDLGIGKYAEFRPFYTGPNYEIAGPEGPSWRTMHLGLDLFLPVDMPVLAVYPGKVKSIQLNGGDRDYGPTVILEHTYGTDSTFWTLYGHLSSRSLTHLQVGQTVEQGQVIAWIGPREVNGQWPPHLHFQIMLDLLDFKGDFPGVAAPEYAEVWKSISPFPGLCCAHSNPDWEAKLDDQKVLLEKRKSKLGHNLSISYREPLKIVRGYGQYLYDEKGQAYLDTVNNVAHVGHQHPKLIEAAKEQINVLNTNTRYLHDELVAYADALLQTFPDPLSVVYFVNSGSEANELAVRMARVASGHYNVIGVDVGYHGNTNACIDISPYKHNSQGGFGPPDWYKAIPLPDTFRGKHRSNEENPGQQYANYLAEAITDFQQEGKGTAAFIAESILSCGGQIDLPEGYLKACFEIARKHGAYCIVDEVQVGFGRVGAPFWGFALQDVVPDIVTLGKPIGNGHPMGAVVCTREVAQAFDNGMEFFSTFGGNPVSCTIGHTVLKIIKSEGLAQKAGDLGRYFKQGLKDLAKQYPIIGDVRGQGLFLGFELVDAALNPLANQTAYLSNRMRDHKILTSTDGPDHNVIKIKPPLAIEQQDIDRYIETLEKILKENALQQIS